MYKLLNQIKDSPEEVKHSDSLEEKHSKQTIMAPNLQKVQSKSSGKAIQLHANKVN